MNDITFYTIELPILLSNLQPGGPNTMSTIPSKINKPEPLWVMG
jgi:hypothetical protein